GVHHDRLEKELVGVQDMLEEADVPWIEPNEVADVLGHRPGERSPGLSAVRCEPARKSALPWHPEVKPAAADEVPLLDPRHSARRPERSRQGSALHERAPLRLVEEPLNRLRCSQRVVLAAHEHCLLERDVLLEEMVE